MESAKTEKTGNNFSELEVQFNDRATDAYVCIVEIVNKTPSNWQAKLGGACKFYYQNDDGTVVGTYTDYHTNLDVPTGQSLYFQSNQPNSCVSQVDVLVYVATPLLPQPQQFPAQEKTDKDHCLKNPRWMIEPKTVQLRSELAKGEQYNLEITNLGTK